MLGFAIASNADNPTEVTESGRATDSREEQSLNAFFPIEDTELGIVTETRELQPSKALNPIDVMETGKTIDVRDVQFWNMLSVLVFPKISQLERLIF